MKDVEKKKCDWPKFLNHKLVINIISYGFLGVVVALVGAKIQYLNTLDIDKISATRQQDFWKEQNKIMLEQTVAREQFVKKAELISDITYLLPKYGSIIWNIYNALSCNEPTSNYWRESQDLSAKINSTKLQLAIYIPNIKQENFDIIDKILTNYRSATYEIKSEISENQLKEMKNKLNSFDKEFEINTSKLMNNLRDYMLIN